MVPYSNLNRRSVLTGLAGAGAVLGFTLPTYSRAAEEAVVNFYNWDTYIGETTLADFTRETGIRARMDLFADNAELFAKLRNGNPGYDVIVPTNDFVPRMVAADMIIPLDHMRLPNFSNLDPRFQDADFDPGRGYSIPYMWGTIGMGYRRSSVSPPPDSWRVLYESDQYAGRIALLSEPTTVFQIAFKYMGLPVDTTAPAHIEQAEKLITKQKRYIKTFAEDNGQDLLIAGDIDIAMEWSGDIVQAMTEDPDLAYALPVEGGILWEDTLCIPKGAPHPQNAHRFINFLLEAEIGAAIADFIGYATPNLAAKRMMSAAYTGNPAIFPPENVLARSEVVPYLGENYIRNIDRAWTRIQAA